ncbi:MULTISPECIES: response regulator [unclassified Rhizobium]|uniref:response regulator n=1 Tax=unclassified Rhizobium TaxID=2613769 RepID=UPI001619ED21|nr:MULTISPECIES: response regulator [unclassified Rhizobium]MBB3543291.1 two-component system OmpR family response regulator [Rhizobium sp. BK399]MCS3741696.1 two-component system OmpR family response regulator [Rhizobium sp. BK661]MCS4093581.1 two-component system OmpR family response regulator [Rhizobium sp. BK176]
MNVLVVEDNVEIGDAVSAHMVGEGHTVDWCRNLKVASRRLVSANYDLVLLDLRLPDGNGLSLLSDIRAANNTVRVIIMTAQDQYSDRLAGIKGGADDFLVKPFDLRELSARMKLIRH